MTPSMIKHLEAIKESLHVKGWTSNDHVAAELGRYPHHLTMLKLQRAGFIVYHPEYYYMYRFSK